MSMGRIKGIRLRRKGKKRSKSSAKEQLKKMNRIWKSKVTHGSVPDRGAAPAPGPISEPVQASSSAISTGTTGAHVEAMDNSDCLPGFIFFCNKKTKPRCFEYQVFGLPLSQSKVVEKIKPGTKLFLFDYEVRLLYGVYEAVSEGKVNLEPEAFEGNFLAQVKFRTFKECSPMPERCFRIAILENYYAGRLRSELNEEQVKILLSLFRPLSSSSSSEHAAQPQQTLSQRMEDQYYMNLSRLHSLQMADSHPIHQQAMAGAMGHLHPSFQHHGIPNPMNYSQELYSTTGHRMVRQEPYARYASEQEWLQMGNDYHSGQYCPQQQEIDAWYRHHPQFFREDVLNGENLAAYASMARNHNIFSNMQPHAPAYENPELHNYLTYASESRRHQPNYPSPRAAYVASAMQAYAPAAAWREENFALPPASYNASSIMLPYAPAPGIPVPNASISSHFSFLGPNQFMN